MRSTFVGFAGLFFALMLLCLIGLFTAVCVHQPWLMAAFGVAAHISGWAGIDAIDAAMDQTLNGKN